jgi:hypothetical protein
MAIGRKDLNHPPTAVGGISVFLDLLIGFPFLLILI